MKKLIVLLAVAIVVFVGCEPIISGNSNTEIDSGIVEITEQTENNNKKLIYTHTENEVITIFSVEEINSSGKMTYTGTIEQRKKTVHVVIWDNINAITDQDKYITFVGEAIIPVKTDTPDENGFYSLSYSGELENGALSLIKNANHVTIKLILTMDEGKNETYIVPREFSEKASQLFQ